MRAEAASSQAIVGQCRCAPAMSARTAAQSAHQPVEEMSGESDDDASGMAVTNRSMMPKKKKAKPPKVTLSVSPTNINEGGTVTITVAANKVNPTQDVTVNYSLTGTALLNTHYTVCGDQRTITIPAGAASASVRLTAIANDLNLGAESATITLSPSSAYKLSKKTSKATVNITNVAAPLCP